MPQLPLNLRKMISYSEGGITSKVLLKTGAMAVTVFCMAAGTELSEHTSTKEGLVYIMEGKGFFVLEGKRIPMLPDALIHMKTGAVHSLEAEEDTSFLPILSG
jgi:quercetin dioxygenase-like cupin family protein